MVYATSRADGLYSEVNEYNPASGNLPLKRDVTYSYRCNGLGDRLQETVNSQTTSFTMDLNTGLTQALSDGTNDYLYGLDRIAQVNTATKYFLGDALGSVRQMTDATGAITYARSYDPYGVAAQSGGASQTAYGYTSEWSDLAGMVYLRARHYVPEMGRFLTRDTWGGDYNRPLSLNRWMYGYGNPVNHTDPSGYAPDCPIKGTCGPDVTDWMQQEMKNHYSYGLEIKNKVKRMREKALIIAARTPCIDIFTFLSQVAIEPPFNQIVREFNFPKTNVPVGLTPLITPVFAITVVNTLGVLEYALYDLLLIIQILHTARTPHLAIHAIAGLHLKVQMSIR